MEAVPESQVLETWFRCGRTLALRGHRTSAAQTPACRQARRSRRSSPALDALIATNAAFEKLGDGYAVDGRPGLEPEGRGFLPSSDIPNNVIQKWTPGRRITEFLKPSGYSRQQRRSPGPEPGSNGLTFDHQGRPRDVPARQPALIARQEARREDHEPRGRLNDGQASEQPERSVLTTRPARCTSPIRRMACRSAGTITEKELTSPGRHRLRHRRHADAVTDEGLNAPNRARIFTRREDALRRAVGSRRRRSGWRYPVNADGIDRRRPRVRRR